MKNHPKPSEECHSLAALSGALLAKLISGALRIPDTERMLERTP